MKIGIPTLGRYDNLLALDFANKIAGKENVFIFFHTQEEADKYQANYEIENAIVTNVRVGAISETRNFMLDFFDDEELIFMDDDVTGLVKKFDNQLMDLTIEEVRSTIKQGFDTCKKNNSKLWGIYPISNAFYMNNKINPAGFIIGRFMGIIKTDLKFYGDLKGDYDFTLQNIKKYGKVIRFDYLGAKFKDSKIGGCGENQADPEFVDKICTVLEAKWGNWIKRNPKRPGEILINLRAKRG